MSKPHFRVSHELLKAADIAVNEVLGVKNDEHVLIITNPVRDVHRISQALYLAAHNAGASPTLLIQPKKTVFDLAEPAVISAIKSEPEVIVSLSAERLGKDKEGLAVPLSKREMADCLVPIFSAKSFYVKPFLSLARIKLSIS